MRRPLNYKNELTVFRFVNLLGLDHPISWPRLFGGCETDRFEKFLLPLSFKNGFMGDITFGSKGERFPKSPLELF
jgi:hypothetical protein